jgi:hypothetical protein
LDRRNDANALQTFFARCEHGAPLDEGEGIVVHLFGLLALYHLIELGPVAGDDSPDARRVSEAKTLVFSIDLKRHQEPRTRALLAAVSAEASARSGEGKKATETLDLFDPDDATFAELRPQLWRARAFAAFQTNDINTMKRALKKLLAQDARSLGGFMMKRTHPLLQKEAKKLAERANAA